MTLEEIDAFIEERDAIMRAEKNGDISERERILARTVKMFEEAGELSDEILGSMGWQRPDKLEKKSAETLAEEFADVVITVFLLARTMHVDLPSALMHKFEKIRQRTMTTP